jgi:hypothetical protein
MPVLSPTVGSRFDGKDVGMLPMTLKEETAVTDWQTYRNGNPRQPWDLERLARHRAAKLGYRVHRSRRRKGPDNAGNLMLIHQASSTVLLGTGYTATVEMILKFMERERMQ